MDIVTSRATPIKTNALVRKNMSMTRQTYGESSGVRSAGPGTFDFNNENRKNNPASVYYQIVKNPANYPVAYS